MRFKEIVIGLLAAILVVNTVMAGLLVTEAKKLSAEAEKQTAIETIAAKIAITTGEAIINAPANKDIYLGQIYGTHRELLEINPELGTIRNPG